MKQPVIAIDVDDVLSPTNEEMMHYVNKHYSANLTWEDYSAKGEYKGYWDRIWKVSKEEAEERYKAFVSSGALINARVMPGAIKAINELKKSYHLVIVSARYGSQTEDTHHWLDKHFPSTFKGVEFVPLWYEDSTWTKAKICKQLQASYLVDDNVEHCNLAAQEGISALLFGSYGWNMHEDLIPGVQRVSDWVAVRGFFDDKSRRKL